MSLSKYDQWKTREPEDYSWAFEQAAEEFEKGYLDGEFEEELGLDNPLLDELHGKLRAEHGNRYWRHFCAYLEREFPRTYRQAREAVIEARIEQLLTQGRDG